MALTVAVVPRAGARQRPWPEAGVASDNGGMFDGTVARGSGGGEIWDVVCLHDRCGAELGLPLASFGHRRHAEAFLDDLLTSDAARSLDLGYAGPGRPSLGRPGHGPDLL